jgi:hypothetical protein
MLIPYFFCLGSARLAMRWSVLLLVLVVGLASPVFAEKAKPMTVTQMEQWLAGVRGKTDEKVAKQLGGLELTERVRPALLARWEANLPGDHSRQVLTALADVSAFLDPPAADQLAAAPPDLKAQGAVLSNAIDYVVQTLTKLPDFYATRTTEHLQDTPASSESRGWGSYGGSGVIGIGSGGGSHWMQEFPYELLHSTGHSSVVVTYRDGVEMRGTQKMDSSLIS